ncbi:MAG: hypothetical protein ACKPFF_35470, partial [Planktothrix sp.]
MACYAFHELREKETVTADEYETLISHVYGNTLGLYSITLRLLGTCKNRNSVIVAWDIKDYTPIFYDQAIEMSHDPAYERHKRACELWEHSSKHDKHPYSSLEEMQECIICGLPFAWDAKNDPLNRFSNYTQHLTCKRKKCYKLSLAHKKIFNTRKLSDKFTLNLLKGALKNGGDNEVFRWLKKNAFRDAG